MITYAVFITAMSIIAVIFQFFNHWLLSKGELKKHHITTIIVATFYIIIETSLALREPSQIGIMLFNIVNVWMLIMAIKGLRRLSKLKRDELSNLR